MWPRVRGRVGPPTPLTPEVDRFELIPSPSPPPDEIRETSELTHDVLDSRNDTQTSDPPYLGASCVLTSYIYTLTSPFSFPNHLPMEYPDSPRRSSPSMDHRTQPYRLLNLSERMQLYRPIVPTLQNEEESTEQTSSSDEEVQEEPDRTSKRENIYQRDQSPESDDESSQPIHSPGLQMIPSNHWLRQARQTEWQEADEPEIIITSDSEIQTDEEETGFNSTILSEPRLAIPIEFEELPIEYEAPIADDSFTISSEDNDEPESASECLDTIVIDSDSSDDSDDIHVIEVTYPPPRMETQRSDLSEKCYIERTQEMTCANLLAFNKSLRDLSAAVSSKLYTQSISMPGLPVPTFKSRQIANKIIKHARNNKTLNEKGLHCLNCDLFPVLPVTGHCGHTRCANCILENGDCPCGAEAPKELHVNTVIQYLIGKMLPNEMPKRPTTNQRLSDENDMVSSISRTIKPGRIGAQHLRRMTRANRGCVSLRARTVGPDINARMPMSPQVQYEYARRLISVGRCRDAAPHLARVAASSEAFARSARYILCQIIVFLAKISHPRRYVRDMFRAVRHQSAASWLKPSDLECVLCYLTYTKPVTTPCGHTYCRTCIERALDYRKVCALCLRPLDNFDLRRTRENEFVAAALESIDASSPPPPHDPNVIPIFVCTVAYPSIPCPLFIFDPRYWLMIRRVLESDSRMFGMVAYERDRNYSDYGTVLEVRDCVHREDGRSFLSTVGVTRFKIIERDVQDGCDVARIQPLSDITPTDRMAIINLRMLSSQLLYKSLMWLNGMNGPVRSEIEAAFGQIPRIDQEQERWWDTDDGPAWLWWLIAILPLRCEIKVLILSTKSLLKRMMAVMRTLEAIDQVAIITTSNPECDIRSALTNTEEWLDRGS